jgi:GDP/UDP-N,N'-diacetylbacillosamine 2-epimerase (hydrolysing)
MEGIRNSPLLELQLVVTGAHLAPGFGLTINEIEADGYKVDRKFEMLLASDSAVGVTKSMGLAMIGFADAYAALKPDLLLVLGDRYEIFAAAAAAMIAQIPIAHLHGGETTEGAVDEAIRHSLTKMSHLHFVAAEKYRRRVIQLGESEKKVFLVGGLGVDCIRELDLLERADLEEALGCRFLSRNLLVTFHPVTLDQSSGVEQMGELLAALAGLEDTQLIFTMPNADVGSQAIFRQIEEFAHTHANAVVFKSLGQLRYLSCIAQVDAVVGNSSSGLTEVPSFGKATINIGNRQRGRAKASSVIDCEPERGAIRRALELVYTHDFRKRVESTENPYGRGGASSAIVELIEKQNLKGLLNKQFRDLAK